MNTVMELLRNHPQVSDFKINLNAKESCELFFVKGKLETVRRTDTCDKQVTVYVEHGEFKGDSQFFIYPSTTTEQVKELIGDAVQKALLINNPKYDLPEAGEGSYEVASNFADWKASDLAAKVAESTFEANVVENAALNSVEVFINKYTDTVLNSRGVNKTQVRYDAMVEAIPTYNGTEQSVELYEQYNFGNLNLAALKEEIAGKMVEVKARYEAVKPEFAMDCPVVLNAHELEELFGEIARDLNFAKVYAHASLHKKGDPFQSAPQGDKLGITMAGAVEGCIRSAKFDTDGMDLKTVRLVEEGRALNYFGGNRLGQYLGEEPTGEARCLCVDKGSAAAETFTEGKSLEVVSMSGLQVDFYNDYIGGEVRLAYYRDGGKVTPVTGISVSGKLSEVLNRMSLSEATTIHNSYVGPSKAILNGMQIF